MGGIEHELASHKQVTYIMGLAHRAGYDSLDAAKVHYFGKGMSGKKLLKPQASALIDKLKAEA